MAENKVVINPETQIASLYVKNEYSNWDASRNYLVSTGYEKEKLGNRGLGVTPVGKHEIAEKIGEGAKEGTVFIGRKTVPYVGENKIIRKILRNNFIRGFLKNKVWTPSPRNSLNKGKNKNKGLVLSRILRIKGLEEQNSRTYERYIYLHGTRNEHKLGEPNTQACIVFSNKNIIDLFNRVSVGCKVDILDRTYNEDKAIKKQQELGLR